jgi:hypothetical protein
VEHHFLLWNFAVEVRILVIHNDFSSIIGLYVGDFRQVIIIIRKKGATLLPRKV